MICLQTVEKYCKDPIKWIENYQEAMADNTQTWDCHHRYEIEYNLSKIELQAMGFYFNRPFHELIFLTQAEHKNLHQKGRPRSKETKQKLRDALKGENNPRYGKHNTEEHRQKISNALKGENNPMYGKEGYWKGKVGPNKGKEGENAPNYKYHITTEELYDLYVLQGLSTYKIAKLYGCSSGCILNKLKKI